MSITIDPTTLSSHFESKEAEERWERLWREWEVHRFDEDDRGPAYVIDTPPPTVSGSLHVGHVFSYTQTDVLARHQRMRGKNVFYPMGWDDNGLPTERRVQNYFHVRCEPHAPLRAGPGPRDGRRRGPQAAAAPGLARELHRALPRAHRRGREGLQGAVAAPRRSRSTGGSSTRRSTSAAAASRSSSFLDLCRKGHVYQVEAPTMWDVDFQTAVAQAEVEDRPQTRRLSPTSRSGSRAGGELRDRHHAPRAAAGLRRRDRAPRRRALPAALRQARGDAALPRAGADLPERARRPREGHRHPDGLHVRRRDGRAVVARAGARRCGRSSGATGASRRSSSAASSSRASTPRGERSYAQLAGKTVKEAQKARRRAAARPGRRAPRARASPRSRAEPSRIEHPVKFFEKGDRPARVHHDAPVVRAAARPQEGARGGGGAGRLAPGLHGRRFRNWTENLNLDWCISRQRYFGVPFPVWYPLDAGRRDRLRDARSSPTKRRCRSIR